VFGYVTFNSADNQIVAAFRGSQNIANWVMNIDFKKVNYKGTTNQVHEGFFASYNYVAS
jgi:predicted lipase